MCHLSSFHSLTVALRSALPVEFTTSHPSSFQLQRVWRDMPRRSESSLRFHIGRSSARAWSFSKHSWPFSMRGAQSFTISPMLMKGLFQS